MSYCLNPNCQKPTKNLPQTRFCQSCGTKLLLKDRYRAIALIGQGGFGRTFLAIDEDKPSKPRCVIKQFFPQYQDTNSGWKAIELFEQEALRLDELGKHPQIPELFAHCQQDDRLYIVQEFIEGQNLVAELTEKGAFCETSIKNLLNDLLPMLQFVHSRQVIHRDIKPENIIRRSSDGKLVLVDFGAAKYATATALSKTGTKIGSAGYASPEQSFGKAVFASDLYSLGVTCIHLLTQIQPFDLYDANESAFVWRQYLVNNPVSDRLGRILDKMTHNVVKRRYQSAEEAIAALLKLETPQTPSNPKPTSKNASANSIHQNQNLSQLRNTIKTISTKVSTKVLEEIALDWTWFSLHYEDCIELYAPRTTVADYIAAHPTWFHRCAYPMKASPIGNNGYDLLIGRYGAFKYEIEVRIGLEMLPPDEQGIYQISSVDLPNYTAPGYQVDFQGSFELKEVPIDPATLEFETKPGTGKAQLPSVMTRWEWQLNQQVGVQFPKFIRAMPQSAVRSTGDRLLLQIAREVSRRLANKVQADFHNTLGIPFPKKSHKK
jgi:serine/threonine protein kinase